MDIFYCEAKKVDTGCFLLRVRNLFTQQHKAQKRNLGSFDKKEEIHNNLVFWTTMKTEKSNRWKYIVCSKWFNKHKSSMNKQKLDFEKRIIPKYESDNRRRMRWLLGKCEADWIRLGTRYNPKLCRTPISSTKHRRVVIFLRSVHYIYFEKTFRDEKLVITSEPRKNFFHFFKFSTIF